MNKTPERIAFVTNICPHYRVRTFELLADYYDADFYFFSAGDEWYWQQQHGARTGNFHHEYLRGFHVGRSRITPTMAWKLWRGDYEAFIKCINGRTALPITYLVARLKRKPFILWTGIWMRLGSRAHRTFFPVTRYIYQHADAIVVYGEHVKRYLAGEGVPAERIFVAAHAVDNGQYCREVSDDERQAVYEALRIPPGEKIVLYLGRLEDGKGLDYLVSAFAQVRHERSVLVLAGEGSQRGPLEAAVRESGLAERVRFAGYVPVQETVRYYALATVYVLPSVTTPMFKEPWGLVVNEAFNQGVPVIATDAVGAAAGGLVQDGVNGFVIPERDSQALAEALQRVLTDDSLRAHLSRNARQIIAGWDNERMVQGFRQAVEYAAAHRGR